MPRRVSTAQVDSTASCRLHVDTTLATRDYGNEALRKRFTCVVAYPFVRRDSRTSVALCTPHLPNCMPTSLQCNFHSASPAEFCSAYVSLDFRPQERHLKPEPSLHFPPSSQSHPPHLPIGKLQATITQSIMISSFGSHLFNTNTIEPRGAGYVIHQEMEERLEFFSTLL